MLESGSGPGGARGSNPLAPTNCLGITLMCLAALVPKSPSRPARHLQRVCPRQDSVTQPLAFLTFTSIEHRISGDPTTFVQGGLYAMSIVAVVFVCCSYVGLSLGQSSSPGSHTQEINAQNANNVCRIYFTKSKRVSGELRGRTQKTHAVPSGAERPHGLGTPIASRPVKRPDGMLHPVAAMPGKISTNGRHG